MKRLRCDTAGSTAMMFGLALPVLLIAVGAAVDYSFGGYQKSKLQAAADSAALAAARELAIGATEGQVKSVADAVARSALAEGGKTVPFVLNAEPRNGTEVKVTVAQQRKAFFGGLLSGASRDVTATATARFAGTPICVLGLDEKQGQTILLEAAARMTAVECAVFSNSEDKQGIRVKDSAVLTADGICSAGGFEGSAANYSGSRMTDCPKTADPLASRQAPAPGPCKYGSKKLVIETDMALNEGTYCGGIEIKKNAKVTLRSGVYVVKDGVLKVDDTALLTGDEVGISFAGKDSYFEFTASSTVRLSAAKTGLMAGILFFGDRNAPDEREYKITSDNARTLLGTIYLPRGYFTVDANNPVADKSAYTVVIVRRLLLKKGPNLVLRADYHASDVPVPTGVGPTTDLRLVN